MRRIVSAAVFDAVNGIERRYAPIHVPAAAPRGASKRAAAVQAAYAILVSIVPGASRRADAKRDASLTAIADGGESMRRGVEWGQFVADAILAVAEHRWIHAGAAPLSGQRRTGQVASDPASVCAWRGAAIRHHDSLGNPVAGPISSPGAARAGQ